MITLGKSCVPDPTNGFRKDADNIGSRLFMFLLELWRYRTPQRMEQAD